MAIRSWPNGVRIVTLGEGTTYFGAVMHAHDGGVANGIMFSNETTPVVDGPSRDDVILQIRDMQGVASYIRALLTVLDTWADTPEIRAQIESMRAFLDTIPKREAPANE